MTECLRGLALCMTLSACGGFIALVFNRRYFALLAPICGVAVLAVGLAGFYSLIRLEFKAAAAAAVLAATSCTALALFAKRPPLRDALAGLGIACAVTVVAVAIACPGARIANGPALYSNSGNDGPNYAQVADALQQKSAFAVMNDPPDDFHLFTRDSPTTDPRSGAFLLLAFASSLFGLPSLYCLDLVAAVAWAAGIIGVAGAVSGRARGLVLIAAGLATSSWFDFIHTGYFGKALAYPLSMVTAVLLVTAAIDASSVLAISMLVFAASLLHSGASAGVILLTLCAPYALIEMYRERRVTERAAALVAAAVVCAGAAGAFSRLMPFQPPPDWGLAWMDAISRSLEIRAIMDAPLQSIAPGDIALIAATLAVWAVLAAIAMRDRNDQALSFLLGPAILLAGIRVASSSTSIAYQLTGLFIPALIVGAGMMLLARPSRAIAGLVNLLICLHLPMASSRVRRDIVSPAPHQIYALRAYDELFETISGVPSQFNTDYHTAAFVFRTEVARRNPPGIFWTERSWQRSSMVHFSGHRVPPLTAKPAFLISHSTDEPGAERRRILKSKSALMLYELPDSGNIAAVPSSP